MELDFNCLDMNIELGEAPSSNFHRIIGAIEDIVISDNFQVSHKFVDFEQVTFKIL